jgi:hypothetical protein
MEDQMSQLMFQHFLKKRNRMSEKTVQRDKKICSKLVHIEQVTGLAKSLKFSPLLQTEQKQSLSVTSVL